MTEASRIGLLGGMFDPIHLGHLAAAGAARRALALDRVLLLPSHVPPHRIQPLASVPHRFAMVALAVDGEEGLVASDLELTAAGPSYTSTTLLRLHAIGYQPLQLFFITGADAFAEIATWRDYPRFLDDAHFVVVNRAGHAASSVRRSVPALASRMTSVAPEAGLAAGAEGQTCVFLVDAPTPDISSTAVRTECKAGHPLTSLVPDAVARHIHRHGLYRDPGSGPSAGHGPAASQLHEQEHL